VQDKYHFYEILNFKNIVNSIDLITDSFKKLSISNHPDKIDTEPNLSKKRFFYICLSYFLLKDIKTKNIYDKYLNNLIDDNEIKILNDSIEKITNDLKDIINYSYKEFIIFLKDELKLISALTAQTAIGLYYDYLEIKEDATEPDLYIDPEEVKPKVTLFLEILLDYIKILGIIILLFFLSFLISYMRI